MYTTIIKEMRAEGRARDSVCVKFNSVRLHNIRNKKIYYLQRITKVLFVCSLVWLVMCVCMYVLFSLLPIHDCIIYNIFRKSNEWKPKSKSKRRNSKLGQTRRNREAKAWNCSIKIMCMNKYVGETAHCNDTEWMCCWTIATLVPFALRRRSEMNKRHTHSRWMKWIREIL